MARAVVLAIFSVQSFCGARGARLDTSQLAKEGAADEDFDMDADPYGSSSAPGSMGGSAPAADSFGSGVGALPSSSGGSVPPNSFGGGGVGALPSSSGGSTPLNSFSGGGGIGSLPGASGGGAMQPPAYGPSDGPLPPVVVPVVPPVVAPPSACNAKPVDVMFVVDSSCSISKSGYADLKKGLVKMLGSLPASARVGAVLFDSEAFPQFELTADRGAAANGIASFPYSPGKCKTRTACGIHAGEQMLMKGGPQRAKLLVVFTDGRAHKYCKKPKLHWKKAAESVKGKGVTVVSVGFGKKTRKIKKSQLKQMASDPEAEHVFLVRDFDVSQVATQVANAACKAKGS